MHLVVVLQQERNVQKKGVCCTCEVVVLLIQYRLVFFPFCFCFLRRLRKRAISSEASYRVNYPAASRVASEIEAGLCSQSTTIGMNHSLGGVSRGYQFLRTSKSFNCSLC